MTTAPRLLLAALALSIITLEVFSMENVPRLRCHCQMTTSRPIPKNLFQKVEVRSPGALCRKLEIIITKKSGSIVCVNPGAKWIKVVLNEILRANLAHNSTTAVKLSGTQRSTT